MTYAHGMETIVRRSRGEYDCDGDGRPVPDHASTCPRVIEPGEQYIEYVGATPAYQSGSRHSIACGKEFLGVSEVDDGADPHVAAERRGELVSSCCGVRVEPVYIGREITKYRCSQCGGWTEANG